MAEATRGGEGPDLALRRRDHRLHCLLGLFQIALPLSLLGLTLVQWDDSLEPWFMGYWVLGTLIAVPIALGVKWLASRTAKARRARAAARMERMWASGWRGGLTGEQRAFPALGTRPEPDA